MKLDLAPGRSRVIIYCIHIHTTHGPVAQCAGAIAAALINKLNRLNKQAWLYLDCYLHYDECDCITSQSPR